MSTDILWVVGVCVVVAYLGVDYEQWRQGVGKYGRRD